MLRSLTLSLVLTLCLAPLAVQAAKLNDADFRLKKGKHDASGEGFRAHLPKIGKHHDRRVSFQVQFDANTAYTTSNPGDQSDCNKVMGISIVRIHEDSIRLGWAFDPKTNKMQLSFYGYYNGNRMIQPMLQVPLGQWVPVEIKLNDQGMSVRAGAQYVEKKVDLGWKGLTTSTILRTAYFGGEETAPHDMDVRVKDISAD
ncbi:MAG: hypothetical protein JST92_22785 [Deltaproteobacteria bacterium]|nr:hypothetical protein [Deltaproteobacteria bacterium]